MTQPLKGWRVMNFRTVYQKTGLVDRNGNPIRKKLYVPILVSGVIRQIRTTKRREEEYLPEIKEAEKLTFWSPFSKKAAEEIKWNHRASFYTFYGPIARQPDQIVQLWNKNGFWGFKSLEEMMNQSNSIGIGSYAFSAPAICEVTHFGKVLEFENIYRSSKMRIDKIMLRKSAVRKYYNDEFIESLNKRYQCEVELT